MNPRPDTTTFAITADSLTEAVNFAITHLTDLVEEQNLRGFNAPTTDRILESFERIDGEWQHVYRFTVDLLR